MQFLTSMKLYSVKFFFKKQNNILNHSELEKEESILKTLANNWNNSFSSALVPDPFVRKQFTDCERKQEIWLRNCKHGLQLPFFRNVQADIFDV